MKRRYALIVLLAVIVPAGVMFYRNAVREREVVILSTNDIHAGIDNFARLATAVQMCRDTVATVVVDAGDRWTGNAYVDLAEMRRPIIDLLNDVGCRVATIGNHEFDCGAEFLRCALENADFDVVCANMESKNGDRIFPPSVEVVADNGVRIFVSGVVTNYDHGHPDGYDSVFEDLNFPSPEESACAEAEHRGRCDAAVLLSHMGRDKDIAFAQQCNGYDVIIGGHSHDVVDTLVNGTVIGQTGRKLNLVGATRIRLKGRKIKSIEYDNIALSDYAEDERVAAKIAQIKDNPELTVVAGTLGESLNKVGLADMMTTLAAKSTDAEVGFYHYGGIRLSELAAGEITLATLYDIDPFLSHVCTMTMTRAQMRDMIMWKYNDRGNEKESHRIDLFSTTPYTVIVNADGDAVDVLLPELRDGRKYRVASSDYVAKKYKLEAENIVRHDDAMLDIMKAHFAAHSPVRFSNKPKQNVVVSGEGRR